MGYFKLLTSLGKRCVNGTFVKLFFLVLTVIVSIPVMAQSGRNVSGTVTDQSGDALSGVTVMISGTTRGTSTDALGSYILEVGDAEYLEFTCLGYKTQKIKLTGQALLSVVMEEDRTSLEEIVVVGYGVQKRRDIVGAVETLTTEDVQERFGSSMSISRTLQGTIPGLTMTFSDGKPTRDATIRIRGVENSIGAGGSALVLLDGVEVDMNSVNPDDIETITVLKDASSTAVYGARGTFGVILLTSKAPEKGHTKITYDGTFSVYQRTVTPTWVTNGYDWCTSFLEAYRNAFGTDPTGINDFMSYSNDWYEELARRNNDPTATDWRLTSSGDYEYFGNTDWWNLIYNKAWVGHTHTITATGGSDIASFYVSGRFFDQEGEYKVGDENWKQYNLMAKGTVNIKPWLRITETADLMYRKTREPFAMKNGGSSPTPYADWFVTELFPVAIPYNPDGTYTLAASQGYEQLVEGKTYRKDYEAAFGTKTVIDLDIIKDVLVASADFGFKYSTQDKTMFSAMYTYSTGPDYTGTYPTDDFYREQVFYTKRLTGDATLTYTPRLGNNHSLTVLAGWNIEDYNYQYVQMRRSGLMTDSANWNLLNGENITISDDSSYSWGMVGAFYRINYSYKSKYLVETSGRYDGSSKFPSNQRWGFFPSGSVGWRISEEGFMSRANWLDNLKIRFSVGSAGNGLISDAYAYMSTMSLTQSSSMISNGASITYTTAPEPIPEGLTWENAITYDVGLDFEAFDGRLNLVFDWYRKNTKNMYVTGEELPAVYGNGAPKGNYADMKTNGWELSAGWRDSYNVGGKNLSYYVKGAIWDSRSFITRYTSKTGTLPTIYSTKYYEGMELGEIWGYVCNGLYQSDEEAMSYDLSQFNHHSVTHGMAGQPKFEDLDGDGAITNGANTINDHGDLVKIGNMSPRYNYSFQAGISWNGIGLSFMFQGVGKRDWYPAKESPYFWGQYGRPYGISLPWQEANRWSEDNPNAYWPLLVGYDAQASNSLLSQPNTRYLQSARYLRVKNITVDYSFSHKVVRKLGLQALKVYVSLENPFTFSPLHKYAKNYDPEGISAGDADYSNRTGVGDFAAGDGEGYGVMKSYTIGLSITL